MTISDRLMGLEIKMKYLEKLMYGIIVIVAAQFGVTVI